MDGISNIATEDGGNRMRAALLRGPDDIQAEEIDDPTGLPGGILIRVEACSICGTDVKMWKNGHRDLTYPRILGHEFVGVVEKVDEGTGLDIGDRVQIWPGLACGNCDPCLRGRDNQCDNVSIIGFNVDGGFAELVSLPARSMECGGVNLVPEDLSMEEATLAEPLACCINGQEACDVGKGDRVLIIGAGPIGVLHSLLARENGAEMVLLAESDEGRRRRAASFSSDSVIPADEMLQEVEELTDREGVDVIINAAPGVEVTDELMGILRAGGRLNLFSGMPSQLSRRAIDMNAIHYGEHSIIGSYGCRSRDCRQALDLLRKGLVDTDLMFTCRIPLDSVEEGLDHYLQRKGLKSIITEF